MAPCILQRENKVSQPTITTGLSTATYANPSAPGDPDYALPAEVEHCIAGGTVVTVQPDPGPTSKLARVSSGRPHAGKARVLHSK
jgi:hypothetical protein